MKVRYIGDNYRISLTSGKIYDVLSIEEGMYRIIDDTEEDYLFLPDDFEALPDGEFDHPLPDVLSLPTLSDLEKLRTILTKYTFSGKDYIIIEEKLSAYLQTHGFDENYIPTEAGKVCEEILDLIPKD